MDDNQVLSEEQVMNGFHAFLVSALRHAKVERLLDDELLASAEADLMICGKFIGHLFSTTYEFYRTCSMSLLCGASFQHQSAWRSSSTIKREQRTPETSNCGHLPSEFWAIL